MKNKKVLVGMSGGVDSSVSAALLKKDGFDVAGVILRFHHDDKSFQESLESAVKVSEKLGIKLLTKDYRELFEEKVINIFIDEYQKGITPNPCVMCNPEVKFKSLIECADEFEFDYVATGHYCRISKNADTGRLDLLRGADTKKDQTYFLYRLTQEQLGRILMPLGEYDKEKVRGIALEMGLSVADKKDSQEICFISEGGYYDFIRSKTGSDTTEGNFVDVKGNILGRHKGLIRYTVGQRKGLGLSLGKPYYVTAVDALNNQVVLGDETEITQKWLIAGRASFIATERPEEPVRAYVKIRSTAIPAAAWIHPSGEDSFKAVFDEPQRAITPGQSAVAYLNDRVLFGGIIVKGGN